ncbi:putative intracellular protein transport-like protein [Phaeoacremonium minimum UCRPA7]|uniref:Putative intracellular protein transport-like protein n=1 Tax=Phaeoacremonium minimum (strain UCR-PA7) TaxID=1286976 RepID=R8BC29_PHAM7|nr:putative intracellular protein transport-like protein [Phaeoacremonium minimum UCRPA7]EON96856.1 putative intracellular protein transport-like protein [Phaeoacremonium minimum UCRPA7]
MEDELKAISAELAASIRREMDLEDLVDRLQAEVNNPQAPGKRTSDYFSDSGYSSAKFSEYDQTKEEVAQIQRRSEQEKAQIRLELTNKLQDERSRRKVLDQQIKELGEKASQIDTAQLRGRDADARVRELEKTCEDLRRRLSEERQVKDNFEDLLSALKGELQNAANERDNLRDEIVPQLKARVEGLEAQASENEKLTYETTKMQQELQSLKLQNTTMNSARSTEDTITRLRSSSVTGQSFKLQHPPTGLSRSNTVKHGQTESREALSERLKDVEAQRDALHNALKSLLERQEFQNRENEKKIKVLEVERDRLLSSSPKKAGYERDVSNLREEINVLRRRAEEAIEQKWLVEKGLIGLKSDLDRAEEEIASLRALLKEKDILIPDSFTRSSGRSSSDSMTAPVTSASLERAYKELQESYREALERIKTLEVGGTSASQDERTKLAMERLELSLSTAIHERDDARQEAASYRDELETLKGSEAAHIASERDLADQLRESARRVEELAQQVRNQLATNATLRTRLSDAVTRGESDQRVSKERLAKMQDRMRSLEEQVVAVQTAAEERVNRHEDELRDLKDAHSSQLQRLRDASGGLRSPRLFPPKSPLSPLLSPNSARRLSPRPSPRRSTTMPVGESDKEELAQVETLKARVQDLESALAAADSEMQEVVGRMNTAQIEVLTLQEERENAVRETRKLQRLLEQERVKSFEERFNSINTMVK